MDDNLTPMMRQYREMKEQAPPEAVLFFRLGDFYEMFFDDAARVSPVLDLTLTRRNGTPMCGVPHHAVDSYLSKLIEAGFKVAIAEQVEDPKVAKGIVKRQISRIITPGTLIDNTMLTPEKNNFLAALFPDKNKFGLAFLDISTADLRATELDSMDGVDAELEKQQARECLIPESYHNMCKNNQAQAAPSAKNVLWTPLPDWVFSLENADESLRRRLNVATLDGFGFRDMRRAVSAAGTVLHYAAENLRQSVDHVRKIRTYRADDFMMVDAISQRNLELTDSLTGKGRNGTLLGVLDDTSTPMGGRLIRDWILRPLFNTEQILARLDAVEALRDDPLTLAETREVASSIRDLERITARINVGVANPREMLSLASSLELVPSLKTLMSNFGASLIEEVSGNLHPLPELVDRIKSTLNDEPPMSITDGGIIREGFNKELDELRKASTEGKNWLAGIQAKEQERTGIKSLKVRYNRVFGYYIEVSKSNLANVPSDYLRKQTLVNAERFITPELKEIESKILGAEEKSKALEQELFVELRRHAQEHTGKIQETAASLAAIDALASLAECARKYNYCRPHICDEEVLDIKGGRHPVLDASMRDGRFVPNDILLDGNENRMMIITGPNMAGKSTYIRQTALLVLMAQMGSFIPADSATIGLVDRIFTRVGAADDISRGQSTFMVEMVETANILNHATPKSLVILDEIGRGTSTFDGISIAWAVAEHLLTHPECRCRTQFATHYHELTELSLSFRGVRNYNVAVKEYGDQIIFLRQIVPGSTDKSYGIHVARLAGLPEEVVRRAYEILENLENNAVGEAGEPTLSYHKEKKKPRRKNGTEGAEEDAAFQPTLL